MGQPLSVAACQCQCHSLGTTSTEPRISTRYERDASACSDEAHLALQVSSDCVSLSAVVDDPVHRTFILLRRLLLLVVIVIIITGIKHDVERCRACAKTVANGAKKLLYGM